MRWKKGKESQIEEWLQGHRLSQYGHLFEGELLGNSIFDLKKQKTKQHYPHFIDLFGRIKFIFSAIWTRTLPKDHRHGALWLMWFIFSNLVHIQHTISMTCHGYRVALTLVTFALLNLFYEVLALCSDLKNCIINCFNGLAELPMYF